MSAYWDQWSHAEIIALHGADEQDLDCDQSLDKENEEDREPVLMPYDLDMLTYRDFL